MPFVTPLLLIGVLAAAIPFALHLLASVRAQDMMFPTLRFLRMSMEKTARRRRLQHWLLLLLRAALFALLAVSVAEPISRATGAWLTGQSCAAALVLDNGYSMAVRDKKGTRFERAKAQAAALLSGDDRPSLAAVLTTNGGFVSKDLSSGLDALRDGVSRARIGYGAVPLAERVRSAVDMLEDTSSPRKAIYVFSDLQRTSFERVAAMEDLARAADVHLLVIDTSAAAPRNVGLSRLEILGRRVVDSALEFTATLVNSSPTDRTVDAALEIEGAGVVRRVRKSLRAAGQNGSTATVRFHHRFAKPGPVTGKVFLDHADDLPADNVRRFSLAISGRIKALVVQGPPDDSDVPGLEPAAMLSLALEPYEDRDMPWPLRPRRLRVDELAPADLDAPAVAFFCEVPRFRPEQAEAIRSFVAAGGTAVFFLGPGVDAGNYNELFIQQVAAEGGLLPGRLAAPVGEVGPNADSLRIDKVLIDHEYFAGLYESHADYLTALVQRYFRLEPSAQPGKTLVRLANGDPLLQLKRFGSGRVVLCTTTASPKWSNLPITGLFLPMVARMSLLARRAARRDEIYQPEKSVTIRPDLTGSAAPDPGEKLFVTVVPPRRAGGGAGAFATVPLGRTAQGWAATYRQTSELGRYEWRVSRASGAPGPSGSFVVNPYGEECNLAGMPARAFRQAMKARGLERVYVAGSLAAAHEAAAAESEGRNWWDLVLAVVIMVLVFEAIVANRRSREEAVPAHLVPRSAA